VWLLLVRFADIYLLQDFPYAPSFTYEYEIAAIGNASFLSADEKARLFAGNHEAMFGDDSRALLER